MTDTGKRLAEWRRERGWSQDYAASLLGVTQSTWAAWEVGRKSPDRDNALELQRLTDGAIAAASWKPRDRASSPPARTRRSARRHPATS